MIAPINSLMNMEMALYGGLGTANSNTPSYMNGYLGQSSYYNNNPFMNGMCNPSFYGYNNANSTAFGQMTPYYQTQNQQQAQQSDTIFGKLSKKESSALVDSYAKNLEFTQTFGAALASGAIVNSLMMNPRIIAHPYNYLTTTLGKSDVNAMFKGVKEAGTELNKLWTKNNVVMEEAFSQMHRAEARSKRRYTNLFRQGYNDTEYKHLKSIMENALETAKKTGNVDEVAKATETLRYAYCKNGKLPQAWNWCKNKVNKLFKGASAVESQVPDVIKMATSNADEIAKNAKQLMNFNSMTLRKAFTKSGGWLGLAFGAIEILLNMNKITTAFSKDKENKEKGIKSNNGSKQVGQTVTKAVANTIGWTAGEVLGIWGAAKLGAAVGTSLGPGIGTAIGAVAGMIGGSIGMWLASKGARALVGDDVSNKIEAENLAKTQEGQMTILQDAAQRAQKGKLDPQATLALQSVLSYNA